MNFAQITAILALLVAFGVPQPTVDVVQGILSSPQAPATSGPLMTLGASPVPVPTVPSCDEAVSVSLATTTHVTFTGCGDPKSVLYWLTSYDQGGRFFKGNLDNGAVESPLWYISSVQADGSWTASTEFQRPSGGLLNVWVDNASTTVQL